MLNAVDRPPVGILVLNRILPFACILGLSSVAFAGPPRAKTSRADRETPARATKSKPARAETHTHEHDDRFRDVRLKLRKSSAASGRVQVYVNGSGATLRGGFEDASQDRSSIVEHAGLASVTVPAYAGDDWGTVMTCVRDQFVDFDIEVTDRRPASDDHIMIMVGGSPSLIGERSGVAGIAPYMGSVIRGAVGFAFSDVHHGDAQALCETVAHEIGHTLGLDHVYECSDTMSYLHCGDKQFQDADMTCGEWEPRTCGDGLTSQNSHGELLSALGGRPADDPAPPPAPDPAPIPDPAPDPEADPDPSNDPSSDEWWDAAGPDEWEQWLIWDPYNEVWWTYDADLGGWVVWGWDDAGWDDAGWDDSGWDDSDCPG